MRDLNQNEINGIAGGTDFNVVYVAANISDPAAAGNIADLVGQLMSGQLPANAFLASMQNANTEVVEYLHVAGNYQPM
ncbi:MAG: hypothetical protein AB7I18_09090 [Candidatus Berkiella sp.]